MSSYLYNSFTSIDEIDLIFSSKSKKYSSNPFENDFIPRKSQIGLAALSRNSNRIIFLPCEEDKNHVTILLLKSLSEEIQRFNQHIIYFVDSVARDVEVTTCLRKHIPLNVASVSLVTDEDEWCSIAERNNILVVNCQISNFKRVRFFKLIPSTRLLIFDDCVCCLNENSMKEILDELSSHRDLSTFNVLGLTSVLIDNCVSFEDIYPYLIKLEKIYNATITTSLCSQAVKKYATNTKIKLVKYGTYHENLFSPDTKQDIELKIADLYANINNYKFETCYSSVKNELKLILEDLKAFMRFGAYPMFVGVGLCRTKLEKIKLKYWGSSLMAIILSMVTDFNFISFLLKNDIETCGSLESMRVIEEKCCWKLQKLIPLLSRINYEQNCVILVENIIVGRMVSYFLKNWSNLCNGLAHIGCQFLIDDQYLEYDTDREKRFRQTQLQRKLKEFRNSCGNVFVISWENLIDTTYMNANWIMYFDLPPDLKSYFLSWKFGNCIENQHFFFLEETNSSELKKNLEPYGRCNYIIKEILEKKNYLNFDHLYQRFPKSHMQSKDVTPLITKTNRKANLSNSIKIMNKFCNRLPRDAFSLACPQWNIIKSCEGAICELRFPLQCPMQLPVKSAPGTDIELLKRAAALQAVKLLYENGLLNENLLPTVHRITRELLNDKTLYPHWNSEDDGKNTGTSEVCRIVPFKFPEWFRNTTPELTTNYYVHVFLTQPKCGEPECPRRKYLYNLLKSKNSFGIVTTFPLPQLCQFPVYMDLGRVDISIEVNKIISSFTSEEITKLHAFHRFLLLDILETVKGFLIKGDFDEENSYFLVPLKPSDNDNFEIDWEVVNEHSVKREIVEPSETERINTDYYKETYIGKVIIPWYRTFPQRYYIVTQVLNDLTPNSSFTITEHDSFADYYIVKYGLEVKQSKQPLLEARALSSNLNCIRPVAVNPGVRRKRGERAENFDEILIPELCVMQVFPAVYWYKSTSLLAIMHRLHYMLLAESIRRQIAFNTTDILFSSLSSENDVLLPDASCISELDDMSKPVIPISSILKNVKLFKKNRSYPWSNELVPKDPEEDSEKTCALGMMAYHDFIIKPNVEVHVPFIDDMFSDLKFSLPKLKFLTLNQEVSMAPKQADVVKAITLPESCDIVNLEFYKFAGNALLKFASSLLFYKFYSNLNIFQLKYLRRKLIGKRNLFYCSSKLKLSSVLKLQNFSINNDWNLSGFQVLELLINIAKNPVMKPSVIFNVEIPRNEQISGIISPQTRNKIQDILLNYHSDVSSSDVNVLLREISDPKDSYNPVLIHFKKQCVTDKAVVDSLKALAGVYLMNCGVEGGFKFLKFVDILKSDITVDDLIKTFPHPNADTNVDSNDKFENIAELSRKLNYQFKSNRLLTQVFTHFTCISKSATECNQKLAFLGDTILDLLFSGYIFENCSAFGISEVKDLRVALVNDVLYSVLVVRNGLHKFLSLESPSLMKKIDEFVSQQERVKHSFQNNDLLFLVEETSSDEPKSVDAPKALSDILKSLVAAIYLDSDGDLSSVWNVCYNIFKKEIDMFSNEIPKNPVKLLAETDTSIEYDKPRIHEHDVNLVEVEMRVHIDKMVKHFLGIGSSKHEASIIAAKRALKRLSKESTL